MQSQQEIVPRKLERLTLISTAVLLCHSMFARSAQSISVTKGSPESGWSGWEIAAVVTVVGLPVRGFTAGEGLAPWQNFPAVHRHQYEKATLSEPFNCENHSFVWLILL